MPRGIQRRCAGMVASARAPMAASSPLQIAMTCTVPRWFWTRRRLRIVSSARFGPSSTNRGRAVRKYGAACSKTRENSVRPRGSRDSRWYSAKVSTMARGYRWVTPPCTAACVTPTGRLLLGLVPRVAGQRGDERLRRDLHGADVLHPLLAGLLLLEQLALAADVTAVALGEDVLADRADRLAGDHARADRGLDRHLELLARDQVLELAGHHHAVGVGGVAVDDRAERVDRLALEQDVDLHQVGRLLARALVVERGVALGARLQLVEEVEDDLAHRQRVAHLDA